MVKKKENGLIISPETIALYTSFLTEPEKQGQRGYTHTGDKLLAHAIEQR